jgi:hypothetical protein
MFLTWFLTLINLQRIPFSTTSKEKMTMNKMRKEHGQLFQTTTNIFITVWIYTIISDALAQQYGQLKWFKYSA